MNYGLLQELTYVLNVLEREERIAKLWNTHTKKQLKKLKELALN
jgi:hypothetical protein